jgi:agmatine deiminase
MKKYLLLAAILFISGKSFTQDLPHYMTEEEKILWENYQFPSSFTDDINPPPAPVRTMAEWEELDGVIITWTSYTAILRQIVSHAQKEGTVYIVCSDSNTVKTYLTSGGVPLTNLQFLITGFNSVWVRDYGPWSVYSNVADTHRVIDWKYNRPRPLDDVIPVFFANYKGLPYHQTTVAPNDFIATGGNFMTDGHGTGFSSKLILNENPSKTEVQINQLMNAYMGISRYIKMDNLPYDQIHHIDMHMKLLDEETLLVGQYPPGVADGPQIEANLQYILNNFQTCFGRPYKVVRIPMPPDASGLYPPSGNYRTFTNSVIINKTVIVPTYQYQYDTTALRIYREAMPGYNIVGIDCNQTITALGAIHCIVKEVGSMNPLFISHAKLPDTIEVTGPYQVKAYFNNKSGIANASVYWTTDTTQGYSPVQMTTFIGDTLAASIPWQPNGTRVFYYVSAQSNNGKSITKPITAPHGYYTFIVDDPLPVELISFNASVAGNNITLKWQTASELNNDGFEVERRNGSGYWNKTGFIKGAGTSLDVNAYSFNENLADAGRYSYRLKQVDFDGSYEYSHEVEVEIISPTAFKLEQNYPNPFNPVTTIKYQVPENMYVSLKVFDILGNEAAVLVNELQSAGAYELKFNASSLSSGIYYYTLQSGAFVETKKLILLK